MEGLKAGSGTWQRKALVVFLALCMVWIVGVVVWVGVRFYKASLPDPWEDEQRKAGVHHEQHPKSGRYYIPRYYKTGKDGSVELRYRVEASIDSSADDFRRTYEISAEPKKTGPAEVTFTDRFGGMRRTFTVTYTSDVDLEWYGETAARITVKAVPD
ncbi:hypothetical protein [Streptomyces cavernicola]|uniref:DUF3592 domain-containing protein n=1 Tax=Streptomyces cavernicola TaxID=3043613 RepID=A0ABT6SIW0_9ACTN|nr:hypothetical protein [Streptomyces sp. B-S-A6]MDI3407829.1 hypothetical protein [Streptomyces sp. B-S-A6]